MSIFDLFKEIESQKDTGNISYIIVGLGNPGDKYKDTRHNAGFIAIDHIAEKCGVKIDRAKFHALVGECRIGSERVLLIKPQTYMNNSGVAVAEAASFYKIAPERVLVLHDEISFDAGIFRIRRKGSAGGHNGLKSIIASLGSEDFPRIKIGVGKKPNPEYDLADWVLGKMSRDEKDRIAGKLEEIRLATEIIVGGDIETAMSKYSH